jgi:hypothetical protein
MSTTLEKQPATDNSDRYSKHRHRASLSSSITRFAASNTCRGSEYKRRGQDKSRKKKKPLHRNTPFPQTLRPSSDLRNRSETRAASSSVTAFLPPDAVLPGFRYNVPRMKGALWQRRRLIR